jgi:hypothetical protein
MIRPTERQIDLAIEALDTLRNTIKSSGRISSGYLYAEVMDKMDVDVYEFFIQSMIQSGSVKRCGDLLVWNNSLEGSKMKTLSLPLGKVKCSCCQEIVGEAETFSLRFYNDEGDDFSKSPVCEPCVYETKDRMTLSPIGLEVKRRFNPTPSLPRKG